MLDTLHPNLLALMSAFTISIARTLYRGALLRVGAGLTALIAGLVTLCFVWSVYFYKGQVASWPLQGVLWFVVVGILGGLGGRYLNFFSTKELGLARTSVLMQTNLIWSTGLAVTFLDERLNLPIGMGTVSIMIGSILLVHKKDADLREFPFFYYFIPVTAAFFLGLSHLLRKFGFFWIDSASFGLAISNTISVLTVAVVIPFTNESWPSSWEKHPLLLILIGAIFNATSALLFWTAVKRGELVQVVPITRISVLLMIFTSWLFFRKQESVTSRVVYGGLLSLVGVFLVTWGK